MPEKCALSHGSGVLGRDPRDTVTQFRLGEGGGGGGVGEPRTGIIYIYIF